ncbi:uncharacterized protein DUF4227 [Fontibacillus phaseoli]|uniref:Uncharacterized protein DUF4227 n=1 Tax=Fontibacillus phaseoli TaxID=1416533 RepID=A0A369BNJ5_9BACL|nr:DUF4227 family protein [Fontibacillus phaseoli]RCX23189.1 uncharacterized protein DUF4227 [Fontibacillus phaseoli]
MVISLRSLLRSLKYLLVFVALAYTLYKGLGLLDAYIFPLDKYRVPEGSAVKVFLPGSLGSQETETLSERLILFFWYGE